MKKKTNYVTPYFLKFCDGVPSHPTPSGPHCVVIGWSGPWGTSEFDLSHPVVSGVYLHLSTRISFGQEDPILFCDPTLCFLQITLVRCYIICRLIFASEADLTFIPGAVSSLMSKLMLYLLLSCAVQFRRQLRFNMVMVESGWLIKGVKLTTYLMANE